MQVPINYLPIDASKNWPTKIIDTQPEFLTGKSWRDLFCEAVGAEMPHYLVAVTCCLVQRGATKYSLYDAAALRDRVIDKCLVDPKLQLPVFQIYYLSVRCFNLNYEGRLVVNQMYALEGFMEKTPLIGNGFTKLTELFSCAIHGLRCDSRIARSYQYIVAKNLFENRHKDEALVWLACASRGALPCPEAQRAYVDLVCS